MPAQRKAAKPLSAKRLAAVKGSRLALLGKGKGQRTLSGIR